MWIVIAAPLYPSAGQWPASPAWHRRSPSVSPLLRG